MNMKKLKLPKTMKVPMISSPAKIKVKGMKKMANSFKGIKNINIAAGKKIRRFNKLAKLKGRGDQAEAEAAETGTSTTPPTGRSLRTKWIAVVKKKMSRPKFPRPRLHKGSTKANNSNNNNAKNIIIIHNNTSIASNDEYNRTSCVEMKEIASLKADADHPQHASLISENDDGDGGNHHQPHDHQEEEEEEEEEGEETIAATSSMKEVDVTSIDSAAPPPPDQASKEDEDEEKEEQILQDHRETKEPEVVVAVAVQPQVITEEIIRLREDKAIILIQSVFRAHLARRAYRALKSLVKLQAVVRGVCVRRQARIALHCMNTLARLQVRVRARQLLNRSTDAADKP